MYHCFEFGISSTKPNSFGIDIIVEIHVEQQNEDIRLRIEFNLVILTTNPKITAKTTPKVHTRRLSLSAPPEYIYPVYSTCTVYEQTIQYISYWRESSGLKNTNDTAVTVPNTTKGIAAMQRRTFGVVLSDFLKFYMTFV